MKSPKKPSKEPPLPSQAESRRSNVLMEQMLSKFDAFGEAQSLIREDVQSMKPDLHTLKEDVAVLKSAAHTHTQEIRSLKEAVQGNTEAIHALQADVATLKSDVAEIKGDIKGYNGRLEVVEAKLAS